MSTQVQARAESKLAAPRMVVYAGLGYAVVAWGGSWVAARTLLHTTAAGQATLSPTMLAALRFSLASLFFFYPLARAIRRRKIGGRDLVRLALLGQLTYSVYFWLQYTGLQQTNASIASILVLGPTPLATAVLAQWMGRERLTRFQLVALVLGFGGVATISLQQGLHLGRDAGFVFGSACLVSNAFAFAIYSNLSKDWMRTISPLVLTGGTMASGALGLLVLSLFNPVQNQWAAIAQLDTLQWLALLFLVVGCSVAAYFAYNAALTQMAAARAAVYLYFEPVVTIALGTTLLAERLTGQALLGAGLIALSVALTHLAKR